MEDEIDSKSQGKGTPIQAGNAVLNPLRDPIEASIHQNIPTGRQLLFVSDGTPTLLVGIRTQVNYQAGTPFAPGYVPTTCRIKKVTCR